MKKLFFVVALLAVVASCTKNEVIPQNDGNKEITYLTAPLTKAHSSFGTGNKFYSYAYLLTSGIWKNDAGSSTPYIDEALISYQTSVWKAAQSYYWPKNAGSSLTFFAWSNGTGTLDPTVGECSKTNGVQFPNYDVSIAANKNKDMMVAAIAADQTANDDEYKYDGVTQGVPTLFYHVLSSLEIKAKVAASYPDVTFKVKNITLKANSVKGSYTQGVDATKLPTAGTWAPAVPAVIANLQVYDNAGFTLSTTDQDLDATADDYRILLPHVFEDTEEMQITYDIITEYTGSEVTETVTVSKKLSEIFTETSSWVAGKKYTLTITLSMNEILWDPAVEEWTAGTGTWSI